MIFWAQSGPGAGGKSSLAEIVVGDIDMDVAAVSGLSGRKEEWGEQWTLARWGREWLRVGEIDWWRIVVEGQCLAWAFLRVGIRSLSR